MTESSTLETIDYAHVGDEIVSHYSAMQLHRKCPQAWYYRYGLHLSRPDTGPAPERDFGSWWGALRSAEVLERGREVGSLRDTRGSFRAVDGVTFQKETVTIEEVVAAARVWWEKQSYDVTEEWESRLGEGLPQRLSGAWLRWLDEWGHTRENEQPLGVEVFWKRDLPRPKNDAEWDALAGRDDIVLPTMKLLGYIDELYWDVKRQMVVARDNKSSKQLSAASASDDMMDSQLQLYSWGVGPKLKEWGLPQVRAVAYDRIKSTRPARPVLTTTGTLSKSVTQYDLRAYREFIDAEGGRPSDDDLAALEPELTEEQWQETLDVLNQPGPVWGKPGTFLVSGPKKGQPKFGVYQEDPKIVEQLTRPDWKAIFHQRTLVPVSTNLIRTHLRAAVDSATDIWRTERRTTLTAEAARNVSKSNCAWCDYAPLCRAQMFGGAEGTYELAELGLVAKDGRTTIG